MRETPCESQLIATIAASTSLQGQEEANFLDFEDAGSFGGDDEIIPSSYFEDRGFSFSAVAGASEATAEDVTFSFEAVGRDNTDGFWTSPSGRDEALQGDLGNYFLKAGTGNLEYNNAQYFKLTIDYTDPSLFASAEIWDIDGPEQYQVTAYDVSGNQIGSLTSPAGGLNGEPWYWMFDTDRGSEIQTIEIEAVGTGNLRGFAFDNFVAHPAPVPTALPVGAAGLGLVAIYRRKRRSKVETEDC